MFAYCPTLQELVDAKTGGLSTTSNLNVIRTFMLRHRPTATLEIGLANGGSCLAFTASHRDNNTGPHVAIDPLQHHFGNNGLQAVERAGLKRYLDFKPESSSMVLPQLLREDRRFGLIYIDGSHLFEDVFVDAYYSLQLLTENGVALFDDSTIPHVAKVIRFIRTNWSAWIKEVNLASYRPSGNSLDYRIRRRLNRVQLTGFRRVGKGMRHWTSKFEDF